MYVERDFKNNDKLGFELKSLDSNVGICRRVWSCVKQSGLKCGISAGRVRTTQMLDVCWKSEDWSQNVLTHMLGSPPENEDSGQQVWTAESFEVLSKQLRGHIPSRKFGIGERVYGSWDEE